MPDRLCAPVCAGDVPPDLLRYEGRGGSACPAPPPAAMVDTVHLVEDTTGTAPPGVVLRSPAVASPSPVLSHAGEGFTPVFRVTSRSTADRAYTFGLASSNPG